MEERSSQLAQLWDNPTYRISASWLDRVERENRGLSATKLIVLAYIYGLPTEQILALCPGPGANESPAQLELVSGPNSTHLLQQGPLEQHVKLLLPDSLLTDAPPQETTILNSSKSALPVYYRRGIIGQRDRTMDPMILPGAIVLIDTQKRSISGRRDWTNEFNRPVYFLHTRTGYLCGFCDLDSRSEWLTLVPHMLSFETNKRWKFKHEVEVIGTVAGIFSRRAA